jgi:WD40 repeat protein
MSEATGAPAEAPATLPVADRADRADRPSAAGTTAGAARYELGAEIARGGMGRIVAARDLKLGRPVAIKILLGSSPVHAARFAREAAITSRLQHPAIIPVHDAGAFPGGEPYYAMKLVEGRSLDAEIAARPTLAERMALIPHVIATVDALAYAHSRRVVHRDLKPSNVLIGAFGEAVVIDWGLAGELDAAEPAAADTPVAGDGLTVAGAVIGTPAFMPPEQARGERVDERADVYALGALLYHVLAGEPPYRGTSEEVLGRVLAGPPPPLAERVPEAPRDLAAIVGKAMAHAPADRYGSARELARDLERFATGQLVAAHRYTFGQRVRRALRRRWQLVTAGAIALVAIAAIGAISVRRIIDEREAADRQRVLAERRTAELTLAQARSMVDRDPTAALAWLKAYPHGDAAAQIVAADAHARGVARHVFRGHTGTIKKFSARHLATSTDGRWAATTGDDAVWRWDLAAGAGRRLGTATQRYEVDVAADGSVVAAGEDGVTLWPAAGGEVRLDGSPDHTVAFAPDGARIVAGSATGAIRIWDVATTQGRELGVVPGVARFARFTTRGDRVVAGGSESALWELATGARTPLAGEHTAAWCAPGGIVLLGRTIEIIGDDGARRAVLPATLEPVMAAALSPDGERLATASSDGAVQLWSAPWTRGVELGRHGREARSVAFAPGGHEVITGGDSGMTRWTLAPPTAKAAIGHRAVIDVELAGDGVASLSNDLVLRYWPAPPRPVTVRPAVGTRLVWTTSGIVGVGGDGLLTRWQPADGASATAAGGGARVAGVALAPDGRTGVTRDQSDRVTVFDASTLETRALAVRGAVMSAAIGGDRVVVGSADGDVQVWTRDGSLERTVSIAPATPALAAISPDGTTIAALALLGGPPRLIDAATGAARDLPGVPSAIRIAFAPDGRRVAAIDGHGATVVVELATGATVRVAGRAGRYGEIGFSPSGRWVAVSSSASTVQLVDLQRGTAAELAGLTARPVALAFAPHGEVVAAAAEDAVRLWDLATGATRVLVHAEPVTGVAFAPDGRSIAVAAGSAVHVWELAGEWVPAGAALHAWLDRITTARLIDGDAIATPLAAP